MDGFASFLFYTTQNNPIAQGRGGRCDSKLLLKLGFRSLEQIFAFIDLTFRYAPRAFVFALEVRAARMNEKHLKPSGSNAEHQ
jgi:hypothetical protein